MCLPGLSILQGGQMDWISTWLGMANSALSRINKQILQSLDEGNTSAMLCSQLIPSCTKNVLNQCDWHSARKRVSLAPLIEVPAYGYSHTFQLPADCIRLVRVDSCLPWSREGKNILSDDDALCVVYIAYPKTPETLDPIITDAITTRLAAELSVSLTSDSTLTNLLYQEAEQKLQKAKLLEDAGMDDIRPRMHDLSRLYRQEAR